MLALAILMCACANDGGEVASNTGGASGGGSGGASSGGGAGGSAGGAGGSESGGAGGGAGSSCSAASKAGGHSAAALGATLATGSLRTPHALWDPASERYVVLFGSVGPSGFRTRVLTTRWEAGAFATGPELELADPTAPTIDSLERALVRSDGASPRLLALLEDTRQTGDPTREVMGQFLKVSSSGSVAQEGSSFAITKRPGQHEYTPSAAWDAGAKKFFVSWSDDREEKTVKDGRLVYGRTVSESGELGPEVRLGGTSLWQTGAAVADSGGAGRFLVAWGDYDLTPGIDAGYRARLVDAQGQPVGPVIDLARFGDHIFDPVSIAWQPCKQAWLVAWMKQEKIFGSWVALDGKVTQENLTLGEHAEGAGAARLLWVPRSKSFALTFHAWKTENAFLQELDDAGTRTGPTKDVNPKMPTLGTFWHPVAARPDRAELVVFPSVNYAEQTASVFAGPS